MFGQTVSHYITNFYSVDLNGHNGCNCLVIIVMVMLISVEFQSVIYFGILWGTCRASISRTSDRTHLGRVSQNAVRYLSQFLSKYFETQLGLILSKSPETYLGRVFLNFFFLDRAAVKAGILCVEYCFEGDAWLVLLAVTGVWRRKLRGETKPNFKHSSSSQRREI